MRRVSTSGLGFPTVVVIFFIVLYVFVFVIIVKCIIEHVETHNRILISYLRFLSQIPCNGRI